MSIATLIPLLAAFAVPPAALAWLLHRARRRAAAQAEARAAESAARRHAETRAAWLAAALEALPEGALVADRELRVLHWNAAFAALSGLPDATARQGLHLADLLRLSAEAGEFGLTDVDQEVARQLALVARGPDAFPQRRHRPDGTVVEFRLLPLPGEGVLLRCVEVPPLPAPPEPPPAPSTPPVAPPPAPAGAPDTAPAIAMAPRQRRCLVLLVEDMQVNQLVTATQLRREGHRVDVAGSGAEALRLAARTPYDLVLMDLMMPGMSGYEAARQLRALPGPAGRVPIFALTANTGEEERARCLAAGMQGMLSKPVPAAALREVLQQGRASPATAAAPLGLLDTDRLAELRRDLPAQTLASLCHQCLVDMAARLQALDSALARGAPDAIEREAHALAGMAGSYGLAELERIARAILAAARRQEAAPARIAAAPLAATFADSRAALLAWLAAR